MTHKLHNRVCLGRPFLCGGKASYWVRSYLYTVCVCVCVCVKGCRFLDILPSSLLSIISKLRTYTHCVLCSILHSTSVHMICMHFADQTHTHSLQTSVSNEVRKAFFTLQLSQRVLFSSAGLGSGQSALPRWKVCSPLHSHMV